MAINGLEVKKPQSNYSLPVQKLEKIYQRVIGVKKMYFFGFSAPNYTSDLVYMCAGGLRGDKSLNRIELSQFI